MSRVYEIIARDEAAAKGLTTFFTGHPCKHGHIAPRYVANAGCLDCVHRFARAARKNPHSHDLIPYAGVTFWRSKRHTPETLAALNRYVQEAIRTFDDYTLGKVCATCDGTLYVPVGDGTSNWKLCEACAVPEPSTADTVSV